MAEGNLERENHPQEPMFWCGLVLGKNLRWGRTSLKPKLGYGPGGDGDRGEMPGITSLSPRNRTVTQLTLLWRLRLHPWESSALAFGEGDFKHPFGPKDLTHTRTHPPSQSGLPQVLLCSSSPPNLRSTLLPLLGFSPWTHLAPEGVLQAGQMHWQGRGHTTHPQAQRDQLGKGFFLAAWTHVCSRSLIFPCGAQGRELTSSSHPFPLWSEGGNTEEQTAGSSNKATALNLPFPP